MISRTITVWIVFRVYISFSDAEDHVFFSFLCFSAGHRLPVSSFCCVRSFLGRPLHAPPPRHSCSVVPVATWLEAANSPTQSVWSQVPHRPSPYAMPAGNAAQPGSASGQRALEQPDTQGKCAMITLHFNLKKKLNSRAIGNKTMCLSS